MKREKSLLKMIRAALFLAIAYVLPFFTGQIPQVGAMLCPMHIPVLLCGFICGGAWGFAVGLLAPFLRSVTLGMPPMFPTAFCMTFELAIYGATAGILYKVFPKKKGYIYLALLSAMILGRAVWGTSMAVCMGVSGNSFGFKAFWTGAVTNAIPGIITQIILIPILVMVLEKNRRDV